MESSSSLDDLRMPVSQFFDSPDFSICQPVESSSRLDDAEITPSGSDEGREHMFDKVVNTSDVGKLNRLVVPKHFAEKYFPLDAAANDKGMLLSFEDRGGKLWQFRYSYWNSSQSYVMTKGWSRFVKEKRLNAGDTVSFCRGATEATRDRLFIDWKCRAVVHDSLPKVDRPSRAVQKRVRLFGVNLDTQQPQGGELTHDANAGAAGVESSAAASSPSSSQTEAHSSLDLGL